MTQQPKLNPKPQKSIQPSKTVEISPQQPATKTEISPDQKIIQTIKNLERLQEYKIKDLVNQAKELGRYLKEIDLKTNQIRKFLDTVNRLKVTLAQDKDENFSLIETEIVLLKPKLAYAAARKDDERNKLNPVKPLSDVLSEAIDKVKDTPDFYRLVQLIESIIAYHKAAGGKN
ncbi:MAG: type III-A CRISPR-associated protein Csm2 [Iphinoe sp. HA4291-MV1]|jgi:CRISPR-associated protein Csm2|nr:type III-A CRISPR-associated protein Csm2 [Iphinoe sp. HA4291-MV1]